MEKGEDIFISYFIRMFSSPSYVIAKHFFFSSLIFSFYFLIYSIQCCFTQFIGSIAAIAFFPFFCFCLTLFVVVFLFIEIETNRQLVAKPWKCTTTLNCCLTAINKHFGKYYFNIKNEIKPFLLLKRNRTILNERNAIAE